MLAFSPSRKAIISASNSISIGFFRSLDLDLIIRRTSASILRRSVRSRPPTLAAIEYACEFTVPQISSISESMLSTDTRRPFLSAVLGIRNPGGHSFPEGSEQRAIEYISLLSLLAYLVQEAKKRVTAIKGAPVPPIFVSAARTSRFALDWLIRARRQFAQNSCSPQLLRRRCQSRASNETDASKLGEPCGRTIRRKLRTPKHRNSALLVRIEKSR
jgi:hypothetical protein